jgi:hypothetical protein
VLFLDIVEYSKKPVAEQLELKQAFNRALATALEQVPQRDRIILDTGDGAAVTFMGDPEDALFAALAVRNMASDGMPVRLGVNLGPVRLVKDLNGQMNIIGDGINVAQRVMSFADPGQLLVSRSFYEVGVVPVARLHEPVPPRGLAHRQARARARGVLGRRRRADGAPRGADRIDGAGARRRLARRHGSARACAALRCSPRRSPSSWWSAPPSPPGPCSNPRRRREKDRRRRGRQVRQEAGGAPGKEARAAERQAGALGELARVELAVRPWGEILVDGKSRGVSRRCGRLIFPPARIR